MIGRPELVENLLVRERSEPYLIPNAVCETRDFIPVRFRSLSGVFVVQVVETESDLELCRQPQRVLKELPRIHKLEPASIFI